MVVRIPKKVTKRSRLPLPDDTLSGGVPWQFVPPSELNEGSDDELALEDDEPNLDFDDF